jgi:hypothetical protein
MRRARYNVIYVLDKMNERAPLRTGSTRTGDTRIKSDFEDRVSPSQNYQGRSSSTNSCPILLVFVCVVYRVDYNTKYIFLMTHFFGI